MTETQVDAPATSAILNSQVYWIFVDPDRVKWPTYELYTAWCRNGGKPSKFDAIRQWCHENYVSVPDTVIAHNDTHGWKGRDIEGYVLRAAPAQAPAAGAATYVPGTAGAGALTAPPAVPAPTPPAHGTLAQVLEERKKQHGDFTHHAYVAQSFKRVLGDALTGRMMRDQPSLSDTQREAAEMILHKLARVLAGDPNHHDHWRDIAGYATITADRIPV